MRRSSILRRRWRKPVKAAGPPRSQIPLQTSQGCCPRLACRATMALGRKNDPQYGSGVKWGTIMDRRVIGRAVFVLALLVVGFGLSGNVQAFPALNGPALNGPALDGLKGGAPGDVGAERLLQRVDSKQCIPIKRCGYNRNGRYRCWKGERCRQCEYVRKCESGIGCYYREKCRWVNVR